MLCGFGTEETADGREPKPVEESCPETGMMRRRAQAFGAKSDGRRARLERETRAAEQECLLGEVQDEAEKKLKR